MPWAAAAAAAGAIGGALISKNASKGASNQQSAATDAALSEQQRQFDLQRSDTAPYRQVGTDALGELRSEVMNPAKVQMDPGYQFGLDQGQSALDRKTAAMGGRVSGAALKGATRYATDYATTGYNAAYQRGQDRLNRLAALAGIGQSATASSAAAGASSSNAISNLLSSQGDAAAAGHLAQGNIWGGAANQLGAIAGRYYTPNSGGLNSGNSYYSGGNQYANFDLSGTNQGSGD